MISKLNDTQVECICASVTAEEPVTAESLRRLAQELGDQAPPTLRGRLRGVRLRNAEPSLVDIASELGLPCEHMHRNRLVDSIVLSLCPLRAPGAEDDVRYHFWRWLADCRTVPAARSKGICKFSCDTATAMYAESLRRCSVGKY